MRYPCRHTMTRHVKATVHQLGENGLIFRSKVNGWLLLMSEVPLETHDDATGQGNGPTDLVRPVSFFAPKLTDLYHETMMSTTRWSMRVSLGPNFDRYVTNLHHTRPHSHLCDAS